ncbi:MAG: protein-L-isoaspartate(D-aspartate) O-methyltransferase [Alphaproteobacteria bacterium]|nr:protein-L-isoaspartate(D-aspartate) O-methyltransferase [Alphaproteobacteria bacterium]MCY4231221.1 protein-L-isoaspartate(D-aspartate) O-methyltransferase [Alphaproteobacteria bacterium]MCY4319537.1 protein-L-isoaspartate(D-aspartate) O-methyltransferase [Alphaproteobacteria bacterium]
MPPTPGATRARLLMMLRRSGVIDEKVLAAVERTPRDAFVPAVFRDRAYEDTALPIGSGQTISRPSVVAFMTAMLAPGLRMRVLEIGTGSGYQAAVLTWLCRRVYTIERHRPLLSEAEARFQRLRLTNITTRCGDGVRGWPRAGLFDRILVTAAADDVSSVLVDQLAEGGRMLVPIREHDGVQRLVCLTRTDSGVEVETLRETSFVPLVGAYDEPDPQEVAP